MKRLLLIGHDANRAGAQLVLLDLLRRLHATGLYQLHLLLGGGGSLMTDYESVATVTVWPASSSQLVGGRTDKVLSRLGLGAAFAHRQKVQQHKSLTQRLAIEQVDLVLVNTVCSSRWFHKIGLPDGIPVVTFVHELAMAVALYSQPDELRYLLERTNRLLAVSKATADYYVAQHDIDPAIVRLFTLIDIPELDRRIAEARALPNPYPALGLPPDAIVIGGCGNAEWRKGCDLFVTLARLTQNQLNQARQNGSSIQPVYFVWIGMPPGNYANQLQQDIDKAGLTDSVRLLPPTPDVLHYSTRFDAFALTSREDPYPLVVFEAGLSAVPVVCFEGAGGAPELVETDGGAVVPYLSLADMSETVAAWVIDPMLRQRLGSTLNQKIRERHNPTDAMSILTAVFAQLLPAQ